MADQHGANARFRALVRMSEAIRSRPSTELFDLLASGLQQIIPFQKVAFYDAQADYIHWRGDGITPEWQEIMGHRNDESIVWWAYDSQEPLVLPSIEQAIAADPPYAPTLRKIYEGGGRSLCALPVTTQHRKLGGLGLVSAAENMFPPEELDFLKLAATQIAFAIDDTLNFREAQRANERLELLLDLTNKVVSTLDLRELLRHIGSNICRVMQCDGAGVSLPDPDTGLLRIYALDFPSGRGIVHEGFAAETNSKIAGVLRTGVRAVLQGEDLAEEPLHFEGAQTLGHFPIQGRDRILGVGTVSSRRPNAFTPGDVAFLERVMGQIAIAVENAYAFGEIGALKDQLMREKVYLEDEIRSELHFEEIVGSSDALRHVLRQVEVVAPTESTVMIYGETGTGKELIARAVHNLSARKGGAFVKLNCAAIPTGLLESELFGHERGAFTGAIAQRVGRFELGNKGTIFLDEIGEVPLEVQPKLLRVLQEREFERLGSSRTLRSDARLIAATNRDLGKMVEEGKFRADLYYRLNVFPVRVPPLRERREDIPLLVRHFVQEFGRRMGQSIESIPAQTMDALSSYNWPGNIRELQNVIERAVIVSKGSVLRVPLSELPAPDAKGPPLKAQRVESAKTSEASTDQERARIVEALELSNWVVAGPAGAAARLGMKRSTLQFRMAKLGIKVSRVGG